MTDDLGIQILALKPGDILVVTVNTQLTHEAAARIEDTAVKALKRAGRGDDVTVLVTEFPLSILRREDQ